MQPEQQPLINFAALRTQVTITQVLDVIGWEPLSRTPNAARGKCPLHDSNNPRGFSVSFAKDAFQCFSGKCGKKGNQLDLAAEDFQLPLYQAAIRLCAELGIEPPRKG